MKLEEYLKIHRVTKSLGEKKTKMGVLDQKRRRTFSKHSQALGGDLKELKLEAVAKQKNTKLPPNCMTSRISLLPS